ncbi:unnamed protein product [Trichobilharzia regenti]|nr:unnamed protein product [Trichobilharzia regenti]
MVIDRRTLSGRQIAVHDRTPCHADHADDGLARHATAAVGLLKAVYPPRAGEEDSFSHSSSCSSSEDANHVASSSTNPYALKLNQPARIVKDVVVFDPRHYADLIERLRLDIMEPPTNQVIRELHQEVRLPQHMCNSEEDYSSLQTLKCAISCFTDKS